MTKKVIVELIGTANEQVMDSLKGVGLAFDANYHPAPLFSNGAGQFLAVEETVCVRGEIPEEKIPEIEASEDVLKVWTDAEIYPFVEPWTKDAACVFLEVTPPCTPFDCDPKTAKGDILDAVGFVGADSVWAAGCRGEGIVIGICDTGVDSTRYPVIGGWSPNPSSPEGEDTIGHGSMCAFDALGTCPEAKLYDIGVLKTTGRGVGLLSDAMRGFQWALERYRQDGTPQILSNSWGIYQASWAPDYAKDPNHPFTRKVREVIKAGIIVTFAAGNCGQLCPANRCGNYIGPGHSIWGANGLPEVITVGAANSKGEWIGYSSQGPASLCEKKPDICGISHFSGHFPSDSGTSAANPFVAGIVGLLKSKKTDLAPDEALSVLQMTAKDICELGWDCHSGYGIVNAKAAFEAIEAFQKDRLLKNCLQLCEQIHKELQDFKENVQKELLEIKELIKKRCE